MVTTSDIVLDLILSRGYVSLKDFALRNGFEFTKFYKAYNENSWSIERLAKVSQKVGVDLTSLTTVNAVKDEELDE